MQSFFDLLIIIRDEMRQTAHDADNDLTTTEISIMRALAKSPRLTQKQLAERTGKHKSQITRAFKLLAGKGLVQKTINPEDGRSYLVETCPHVALTLQKIMDAEEALTDRLLTGFSQKEREQFNAMVVKMLHNIRE